MANNVVHFAITADDAGRAQAFYARVFGWRFEAWGPPDFFNIHTGTDAELGIMGALEVRDEKYRGAGMRGFICTVSVESADETSAAVVAADGTIVYPPMDIPTVGRIVQFEDTEGNVVSAMQYLRASGG